MIVLPASHLPSRRAGRCVPAAPDGPPTGEKSVMHRRKALQTLTVERNSVDVAAAVKAIVPAHPQAIVQISAYKSCAAFVREARKAGFGGQFGRGVPAGGAGGQRRHQLHHHGRLRRRQHRVEALRRVPGAPTHESFVAALESLADFNLGGFHVDFGPTEHAGSSFVDLTIVTADGRVRR
jgi:hypothetical protein